MPIQAHSQAAGTADNLVHQATGIAVFKLNWLCLILAGNAAVFPACLLTGLQAWLARDRSTIVPVLIIALSGAGADTLHSLAGLYAFASPPVFLLPTWLWLLWLSFALLLTGPLAALLRQGLGVLSCAGAALGVAGYGAAVILDAAAFALGLVPALMIEAITWSGLMIVWSMLAVPRPAETES